MSVKEFLLSKKEIIIFVVAFFITLIVLEPFKKIFMCILC